MAAFPWHKAVWLRAPVQPRLEWPVRLARVDGPRLTLAQPVRLPCAPSGVCGSWILGPTWRVPASST